MRKVEDGAQFVCPPIFFKHLHTKILTVASSEARVKAAMDDSVTPVSLGPATRSHPRFARRKAGSKSFTA